MDDALDIDVKAGFQLQQNRSQSTSASNSRRAISS